MPREAAGWCQTAGLGAKLPSGLILVPSLRTSLRIWRGRREDTSYELGLYRTSVVLNVYKVRLVTVASQRTAVWVKRQECLNAVLGKP